jgi:signal peptidase I
MQNKVVKEIISWIMVFVFAFFLALFINKVIIYKVKVPSGSMETTIMTGDKVLTYRLAYLLSDPKRGDIIVFPFPDNEKEDYIKRIIGLPGDSVEGRKGIVYINGDPIDEPYLSDENKNASGDFGPYKVPKNSYFMMGDNRNVSEDSRFWDNKFVKRNKIIGKAFFKYNFKRLN